MTKINEALLALKEVLEGLNPWKPCALKVDEDDFYDPTASTVLYIPEGIHPQANWSTAKYPQAKDKKLYANKVVQAVFNLVHYASQGFRPDFLEEEGPELMFQFLGPTALPKIINEQTFEIGLAIRLFLLEVLTEEGLNAIPESLREKFQGYLQERLKALNVRLNTYKSHKADQIEKAIENIKLRNQRVGDFLEAKNILEQRLASIIQDIPTSIQSADLSKDVQASLEARLEHIKDLIANFEEQICGFSSFVQTWHKTNQDLAAAQSVYNSPYIRLLMDSSAANKPGYSKLVISELERIYNEDNYPINEEKIHEDLNTPFKSLDTYIYGLRSSILSPLLTLQKRMQQQVQDAVELREFKIRLAGIFPADLKNDKLLPLTLNELKSNYINVFAEMEHLKKALVVLEEQYPIPNLELSEHQILFHDALESVRRRINLHLADLKQKSINIRTALIKTLKSEYQIPDSLEKAREALIIEREKMNEHSAPKLAKIEKEYRFFIDQEEPASLTQIQYNFSQAAIPHQLMIARIAQELMLINNKLKSIKDAYSNRKLFLDEANKQLVQYLAFLEPEHLFWGKYVSEDKIPQSELIRYLECKSSVTKTIEKIYTFSKKGGAFLGINVENLKEQLWTSTSENNIEIMREYIAIKRELIKRELEINITLTQDDSIYSDNPTFMPINNIGTLKVQYLEEEEVKRGVIDRLENQKQKLKDLEQQQKQNKVQLEEKKKFQQQAYALAKLEHRLDVLSHNETVAVVCCYELEQRMAQMHLSIQYLAQYISSFSEETWSYKDNDMQHHEALSFENLLMQKINNESSANDLLAQIKAMLETQEVDLAAISSIEQEVTAVYYDLKLSVIEREVGLDKLKTKQLQYIKNLENYAATINTKKEALLGLQRILKAYQLLKNNCKEAWTAEYIDKGIKFLEEFETHDFNPLRHYKEFSESVVVSKFKKLEQELKILKQSARAFKLAQIMEKIQQLNTAYVALDQKDEAAKAALLISIRSFKQKEQQFLSQHRSDIDFMNDLDKNEEHLAKEIDTKILFDTGKNRIILEYFGSPSLNASSIFGAYLLERASNYWLYDCFSSFAALLFGYFGYKSDAQQRQEYIAELEQRLTKCPADETEYQSLCDSIDLAMIQFKPRCGEGQVGYNLSLHSKLMLLRAKLTIVFNPMLKSTNIQPVI